MNEPAVDGTVWINFTTSPHEPPPWSGWQPLGRGSVFNSLALGPGGRGVQDIGVAPDNTVWRNDAPHRVPALDARTGQWSGWQPFGAPSDQFRAIRVVGFHPQAPNLGSEVFGLALDDTIWRRNSGSNAWAQFGTPANRLSTIVPMIVYGWAVGVAGTVPDGTAWYADWDVQSGQWGPLQPMGSDRRQLRQFDVTPDSAEGDRAGDARAGGPGLHRGR